MPGTKIGRIIDVRGDGMVAVLDSAEQGEAPKVTIGHEDVLIGQIGSYVKVVQGNANILAMLTRMSELEKLEAVDPATPVSYTHLRAHET